MNAYQNLLNIHSLQVAVRRPLFVLIVSLGLVACGGASSGSSDSQNIVGTNTSVAAKTSTIQSGDPDCVNGGVLVETGIDENSNGVLDASEVDASEKVCNGAPGTIGISGSNGTDGFNALVNIVKEGAGRNCVSGGRRIDSGLDVDGNGSLDAKEIVSTDYVCNGVSGSNGLDGNNGLNALINMNPEPVGVNCPNGGLRIDVGIDSNGNSSLDAAEITQTGFACGGADGGVGWQVATLLEISTVGAAYYPEVSVNASGSAMVVWHQWDGSRYIIWANRYVPGAGWGIAERIDNHPTKSAAFPKVSVNANGNAMVVWQHSNGVLTNIWANRYVVGVGWGKAEIIETNTGDADLPDVSLDASGNAMAIWPQFDGTRYNIWANRYLAGVGWGTAEIIETNAGTALRPDMSVDSSGNAVAVWQQFDGVRSNIWSNRYVVGQGWGTAELIESDNAGDATFSQVSVSGGGLAVAVWRQSDGTAINVWSNIYLPDSGWGKAELIETDNTGHAYFPRVSADDYIGAVAVWHQWDGTRSNIWSNRYEIGVGWNGAELIEVNDAGTARYPRVSASATGSAVAVWSQTSADQVIDIWSNRYVAGRGWGVAELIETRNSGAGNLPKVAMDANGNAVVVWLQPDDTSDSVWSNRWNAP